MAKDIAQEITDMVIQQLEQGVAPWRKPWNVQGLMATSLSTGKPYQGINAFWLGFLAQAHGYDQNLWTTYKQAQALGGNVKKGEHGTDVVYWAKVTGKPKEGEEKGRDFMLLKYYTVFNIAQCENVTLPPIYTEKAEPVTIGEGIKKVLSMYSPADILHRKQGSAFYSPTTDVITLPPLEAFERENDYAETLFHELTHSTGHESRLNRFKKEDDKPRHFGSELYAKEELVAELGANLLGSRVGMDLDLANTASYIKSWLKALQEDKNLIIQAAQRASKAVDYMMGAQTEGEEQ